MKPLVSISLFLSCAALAVSLCGCASSSSEVKEPKWITLFDGSPVTALRGYRKEGFPDRNWIIDNGALKTVPGTERIDLITRDKFRDFELELEWKLPPAGNSGVMYGVQETDGPVWHTGPEMQVLDDDLHRDGQNPKTTAGALYGMIVPNAAKKLKPIGEFNQARVIVKQGRVEHWLNGAKIVEYQWYSPDIQQLIADSKFKDLPLFMKNLEGHIAFQHHGEEVWFRNIRIRKL